jgi:hypothetical protein
MMLGERKQRLGGRRELVHPFLTDLPFKNSINERAETILQARLDLPKKFHALDGIGEIGNFADKERPCEKCVIRPEPRFEIIVESFAIGHSVQIAVRNELSLTPWPERKPPEPYFEVRDRIEQARLPIHSLELKVSCAGRDKQSAFTPHLANQVAETRHCLARGLDKYLFESV